MWILLRTTNDQKEQNLPYDHLRRKHGKCNKSIQALIYFSQMDHYLLIEHIDQGIWYFYSQFWNGEPQIDCLH